MNCKATVRDPGAWRGRPCERAAMRDGYCAQHHPDAKAAREAAQEARWKEKEASNSVARNAQRLLEEKGRRFDMLLADAELAVRHMTGLAAAIFMDAIAEAKKGLPKP